MPLVKVKDRYQVTLPPSIRTEAGLAVGDLLEARVEGKKITLTPKAVADRHVETRLAESFADYRKGRVAGPFTSAKDAVRALRQKKKRAKPNAS
jgi:AbrB family looped-hinge helix DNA binding protein